MADTEAGRPADRADRDLTVACLNRLCGGGLQVRREWSGTVYAAFVFDVLSRRIVDWRAATSMTTEFVLDTAERAVWTRLKAGVTEPRHCAMQCWVAGANGGRN